MLRAPKTSCIVSSTPLIVLGVTNALMIAALAGCATARVAIVGRPRPAISPQRVQIYLEPPPSKYEQIANLSASSRGSFAITAEGKMDKVIERLKREAAKLGANGILLHGVGDQAAGSVGAGISTESGHSPYVSGLGVSAFLFQESGDGDAIYVEANN